MPSPTHNAIIFSLKASRPGLWFPTLWLYLMPLAEMNDWMIPSFWIGLLYVCFPLNLLVYGWNDLVDTKTDRINPRKNNWLFGACGTDQELKNLPRSIVIVQLCSWPILIWFAGPWMVATLCGIVLFCWIYNHPMWGWRQNPPLELLCQVGYLLTLPISCLLNKVALPSSHILIYLCLFCLQSQLLGEVMDIRPDRAAGRRTTATELSILPTKRIIMVVVLVEFLMLGVVFHDWIFAAGMGGFFIWLVIDYVKNRERDYTKSELTIFGVGSNVAAIGSMVYIWWSGIFL